MCYNKENFINLVQFIETKRKPEKACDIVPTISHICSSLKIDDAADPEKAEMTLKSPSSWRKPISVDDSVIID